MIQLHQDGIAKYYLVTPKFWNEENWNENRKKLFINMIWDIMTACQIQFETEIQ